MAQPTDPENEQPATQLFTRLIDTQMSRTLVQSLVPVTDAVRDIATMFGARPYEVHRIVTQWSGGKRGVGTENVVSDQPILPTPLVIDLTTLGEIIQPIGQDEFGGIKLSEVTGRYEEDWFFNKDLLGNPPPPDVNVYFEIQFLRLDGRVGQRRRFFLNKAPYWNAENVFWELDLVRAREDRTRINGVPR